MAAKKPDTSESGEVRDPDSRSGQVDPRNTNHPTGAEHADENAANESAS
jgi:hypothetical protein